MSQISNAQPGVTSFVHIGLVVEDLDEAVRFLTLLGFDCDEPAVYSGEWIDRIIGLENATVEVVMARGPDGSDMFEVVRFHSPSAGGQEPAPAANRPGLRHIAFTVDELHGVVDRLREAGWDTVGEIVNYENVYLLCYVRGPEGLIIELAERIGGSDMTEAATIAGQAAHAGHPRRGTTAPRSANGGRCRWSCSRPRTCACRSTSGQARS